MSLSDKDTEWFAKLTTPERDKGYTRTFYSYPAKFQAKLPRGLIKRYSSENDLIFDPFVGGGTTGLESMLLNRKFLGYRSRGRGMLSLSRRPRFRFGRRHRYY